MIAPRLVGYGPVTFSTSLEMMPRFRIVWDTNGWYAALGISVSATRKEIREAYQRLKGWRNPRLTYIITQLIDPEIRRRYDEMVLGSLFMDYEVETWMRRKRIQEVIALRKMGFISEAEELEKEAFEWESENLSQSLDSVIEDDYREAEWPWAYYLWNSLCEDKERLRQWQGQLISVLGERKEHHQLAVGFMGEDFPPWDMEMVGYRLVVFLNESEFPTEVLAQQVASEIQNSMEMQWLKETPIFARVPRQQQKLPRARPFQGLSSFVSRMAR